jgi:hypothetical protein
MKFPSFLVPLFAAVALAVCGCRSVTGSQSAPKPLEASRLQLLEATITHDESAIQPLLAPDFTWREDDAPLTETAFDFWNRQKLWGVLHDLLEVKTASKGEMKVAPRQAVSENYSGPRLAWRKVGNEWKLAYFFAGSTPVGSAR